MALPQGFIDQISPYPQLEVLLTSLESEPEVSVRVNPQKSPILQPTGAEHVPWCEWGYYLDRRPAFTFDPAMHQGLYYVQDASSMAIAAVLRQIATRPVRYLDACAAPGGKTTTALSVLPYGSVVVANEYDYKRAEILVENISKWGNPNVVVSRGDTSRLRRLRGAFDIVAVDAPCSGEGMMRKDQQAIDQWSAALVEQCAATQRQILENAWEALAPGGYLIYSTCTFNTTENESNLHWLINTLGALPVDIGQCPSPHQVAQASSLCDNLLCNNPLCDNSLCDSSLCTSGIIPGIDTPYPCYRFIPGLVRGEGLFLAVVQKPGYETQVPVRARLPKDNPAYDKIKQWFAEDMYIHTITDHLYALPKANATFMLDVASKLDTLLLGVDAASVKGRDIIPTHQLALSTALSADAFPTAIVDYSDAIAYLRHESLSLPPGTPRGLVLLQYDGHPLGMVKNLGNRANNLMPKTWRILSQSTPSTPVSLLSC